MSWASRRRTIYGTGVALFFLALFGGPIAYWYFTIPPTCSDGLQNQGETAPDRGGPCPILDENRLTPTGLLWTRGFRVRDGSYNAVAYLQNPNNDAGVRKVKYRFGLYDERNILVAERDGETFIMPGQVTAIFEGGIDTGSRVVAHTYFEFLQAPIWERLQDTSIAIEVKNTDITDIDSMPRLKANVRNTSVKELRNIKFVAVVSDPAGNAFAASQTALNILPAGRQEEVVFTWPDPFTVTIGRIVIIPISAPLPLGE